MPLFEYQCKACHHHFELLVRSTTTPTCPTCGSLDLDKCITAPAPPGKSAAIIKANRKRAAAEGHLSNYSPAERRKV